MTVDYAICREWGTSWKIMAVVTDGKFKTAYLHNTSYPTAPAAQTTAQLLASNKINPSKSEAFNEFGRFPLSLTGLEI